MGEGHDVGSNVKGAWSTFLLEVVLLDCLQDLVSMSVSVYTNFLEFSLAHLRQDVHGDNFDLEDIH